MSAVEMVTTRNQSKNRRQRRDDHTKSQDMHTKISVDISEMVKNNTGWSTYFNRLASIQRVR